MTKQPSRISSKKAQRPRHSRELTDSNGFDYSTTVIRRSSFHLSSGKYCSFLAGAVFLFTLSLQTSATLTGGGLSHLSSPDSMVLSTGTLVSQQAIQEHGSDLTIKDDFKEKISHREQAGSAYKNNPKPPHGYCTHISRAVAPSSRCFKHLIVGRNHDGHRTTKYTSSASSRSNLSRRRRSKNNLSPRAADVIVVDPNNSSWSIVQPEFSLKISLNKKQGEEEEHDVREELVYVRLETIGLKIGDLKTWPINERLLVGVLEALFSADEQTTDESDSKNSGKKEPSQEQHKLAKDADSELKAQILGSGSSPQEKKLADKCRSSIEKFLCRLVYPSCHFRQKDASALVRPPCREDCLLLRDVFCPNLNWHKFTDILERAFNATLSSTLNKLDIATQDNEFAKLVMLNEQAQSLSSSPSSEQLSRQLNSSVHYYWPHEKSIGKCESLPTLRQPHHSWGHINRFNQQSRTKRRHQVYHDNRKIYWPICSNAQLTHSTAHFNRVKRVEVTQNGAEDGDKREVKQHDCLYLDGSSYSGAMNQTKSGHKCQFWDQQIPHQHSRSELLFDNMREAKNYCRNPGGLEWKPWCYTENQDIRWEYCQIAHC